MANFDSVRATLDSSGITRPVWADFQNLPKALQRIENHLNRYQSDPDFRVAMDIVFDGLGQIQELGQIAVKVRNLLDDLRVNHISLFGFEEE